MFQVLSNKSHTVQNRKDSLRLDLKNFEALPFLRLSMELCIHEDHSFKAVLRMYYICEALFERLTLKHTSGTIKRQLFQFFSKKKMEFLIYMIYVLVVN